MNEREIHFSNQIPILELEDEYRRRYAGSEAHFLHRPVEESLLTIDIRNSLPYIIAIDQEAQDRLRSSFTRMCREAMYECGKVASAIVAERAGK